MDDRIAAGHAHLARRLKEYASRSVTYVRGTDQTPVTATVGKSLLRLSEDQGGGIVHTDRDYLIARDELPWFDGLENVPKAGHRIEDVNDEAGQKRIYEVLAPPGEPVYNASGYGMILRIHTKLVKTVET